MLGGVVVGMAMVGVVGVLLLPSLLLLLLGVVLLVLVLLLVGLLLAPLVVALLLLPVSAAQCLRLPDTRACTSSRASPPPTTTPPPPPPPPPQAIRHLSPGCSSSQLQKNLLSQKGRAVFRGLIRANKVAARTVRMRAWAGAVRGAWACAARRGGVGRGGARACPECGLH
jgi:hypothetical protein